jgi:DNA-binding FrmR family transcriptional regulator
MAHVIRQKKKIINRVRRIRGQVDAVERAVAEGMDCADLLQRISGCRGAINGLLMEVLEDHVRFHIINRRLHRSADPSDAGREILDVIRTYLQ